jgi:hypothetical protein
VIDPLIQLTFAGVLSLILVLGAVAKMRDLSAWRGIFSNYGLLPERWTHLAGTLFICAELSGGALLLFPRTMATGATITFGVLLIATGAVIANLLRGRREIQCGCAGLGADQTLSWWLVIRNCALVTLALLALMGNASRQVGLLDGVVAVAAAISLAGLYTTVNQVLSNQPRLVRLRESR